MKYHCKMLQYTISQKYIFQFFTDCVIILQFHNSFAIGNANISHSALIFQYTHFLAYVLQYSQKGYNIAIRMGQIRGWATAAVPR